ncbi:MAG: GGDEF domain-containing protein [Candidatus Neomarinimicrobiota bacterium]|nr:GGDEF domain-containing protein [Candidatus Neomarinimicrobiota bacterium]
MSSLVNLTNFTRALAGFCLVAFLYALLPDSNVILLQILKYVILIGIVFLLLFYNNLLGILTESVNGNDRSSASSNETPVSESLATNAMYENLKSLVLSSVKSMNPNFESGIYMIDPESQVFTLQGSSTDKLLDTIPASNPILSQLLQKSSKVNQKDNPDAWNDLFNGQAWRGSECVFSSPISMHNTTAGFVLCLVSHFSEVTDKEITILKSIGDFVSHGLENLETMEKYILGDKSKNRILQILSDIDFKSDEEQILDKFKFLIQTSIHYDRLTISSKMDIGLNSVIKLTDGLKDAFEKGTEFPTNGSLHGLPIVSGETVNTSQWNDSHANMVRFHAKENDDIGFQSVLGVPLLIEKESRGSILLERLTDKPFSDLEAKDLEIMGRVLGATLHWLIEYEKIYKNATHDGLSDLLNHQTFKERFVEEIQRAERFQHNMAVMIFDLDKFKKVNDTLGHQYGDYVIKTVSQIMKDTVRAVDVVARYGGEEFAIILINTTAEMSLPVAQRIVDKIANYNFSMKGEETHITISGGISEYPTHSPKISELIEYADQSMYKTKQNGGNGITVHNSDDKD